jgi:serine/threonine protein kinase/tetratricopeptide (TPR) repeat protein
VASEPVRITEPVKFGEDYELDVRAYELRRSGRPLKVERIPMELLVLLVELRGQLVTRDQIIERIWGKDVYFDSDNSINSAIRKIRQVLKDDPERPRFVVTVTGKGYRFVAPVEDASPPPTPTIPSLVRKATGVDSLLGKKVSHYRVIGMLGGGGMGVVYKAEDLKLGRLVAMKFLPAEVGHDPIAFERLQREARAASALDHPNICSIYELGEHEAQPFIVMQLLEGQTLREWIEKSVNDSTRLKQLIELAVQILDGLGAAHERGIIHRDIKPANIFITNRGHAKILDFGVAKFLDDIEIGDASRDGGVKSGAPSTSDPHLTRTGASIGTPSYLSPEQIRRDKLDARTDLFSFGLVLYEMATGRQAFSGDTVTVIRDAVLNLPPVAARQVCPDIPVELEKIINKSLGKNRDLRYQSAPDMKVDLMEISVSANGGQTRPRRTLMWVAAGLAFLMLALAAFDAGGIRRMLFDRAASGKPAAAVKPRTSVAVLGFRNLSGKQDQAWISTALSEMLSSDLSAGQQLRIIPGEDVARMRLDLNLPAADNYSRDTLRQIRNHLGTDIVVLGSYLAVGKEAGGKVRIDLQLQDAREGETIGVVQSDGTEAGLAELVSQGGSALRQKLGVASVSAADARQISASVPANPEAARLYAEGLTKLHDSDALAARDLLEQAIRLDPKHALSHSALAEAWSVLGYDVKAATEAKLAFDLSSDLPREQKFSIEGRSHEYGRDLPGAIEIYKTLRNFFPDNLDYALRLASAQTKAHLGKDALQTISRARQLPKPDSDDARLDLVEANASESLGDFSAAQRSAAVAAQKAQERGRRLLLAQAKELEAFTWERLGQMDKAKLEMRETRDLAEAVQSQGLLGLTLRQLGVFDEDTGEYENARISHKKALAIFQKIGMQRQVARTLEGLGNIDYEQGRLGEAKQHYEEALRVDREIAASPGNIASDLGSIANVMDGSGDLVGATQMQEQSLKGFREAGDKRGQSSVLINLGNVLVERGEMASAKQNYDQALSIAREIGYRSDEGFVFNALVDIHLAQDRLQDARSTAQRAIAIRQELQERANLAQSQLELAIVALEEGKAIESEQLARLAAPVFEQDKMAANTSVCASVLARAFLAQSRIDDSKASADKALVFAHQTVDRASNFYAALAVAEVNAAQGKGTEAIKSLETVLSESTRHGYLAFEYEARFDIGRIELQTGNRVAGRKRLQQLQEDARSKNYLLVARKARTALNG